jgi:hypothetical protein
MSEPSHKEYAYDITRERPGSKDVLEMHWRIFMKIQVRGARTKTHVGEGGGRSKSIRFCPNPLAHSLL